MNSTGNNLPLVPGNWRSGRESNVNNTWNRPSPAMPPFSYMPATSRDGGRAGSGYNHVPASQGYWRSGSESDGSRDNNWNRPSQEPPRAFPYSPVRTSGGAPDPWSLFEDRVRTGPFGLNSFPSHPFSPLRIIVLDNEMSQEVNPRLRRFIQESPPRVRGQWQMQLTPEEEESRLTQEEQRKALKKLKKQVYNPYPKNKNNKWSLYYRDNSSNSFNTRDEDGKGCAICLEDFVPKQEVLVTPCSHMFHDDCIIPWIKSNGQCPVCRYALGERREGAGATIPMNPDLTALDLISLIRAMEEAFQWVNVPRYHA